MHDSNITSTLSDATPETLTYPVAFFHTLKNAEPYEVARLNFAELITRLAPADPPVARNKEYADYVATVTLCEKPFVKKTLSRALREGRATVGLQRSLDHIVSAGPLWLGDYDVNRANIADAAAQVGEIGCAAVLWSSISYLLEKQDKQTSEMYISRAGRLGLFLDREVAPQEYDRLSERIVALFEGKVQKLSIVQPMGMLVRSSPGAPFHFNFIPGKCISVDKLLAQPVPGRSAKPGVPPSDLAKRFTAGLAEPAAWFASLTASDRDACLEDLLAHCDDIAASSARKPWWDILVAAHASGAPGAREIAREWSRRGDDAYCGDAEFDKQWNSFSDPATHENRKNITIGTLVHHAKQRNFDSMLWVPRQTPRSPINDDQDDNEDAPGMPAGFRRTRPVVTAVIGPGRLEQCLAAIDAAVAGDPSLFRRGDALVSLPPTTMSLPRTQVVDVSFVYVTSDKVDWRKPRPKPDGTYELVRVMPPRDYAKDYLQTHLGKYGAQALDGVSRVPLMDANGGLLGARDGACYDPARRVFVDLRRCPVINTPTNPTSADILKSRLAILEAWSLYEVEAAQAHLWEASLLALTISAIARPSLETCPVFMVTGNNYGIGKSHIPIAHAYLAWGCMPYAFPPGEDKVETDKRIDTALLSGAPFVVYDNVNRTAVTSNAIAMMMSAGETVLRPYGHKIGVLVQGRPMFMICGEHVSAARDLVRRTVPVNVFSASRSPHTRHFAFDPVTLTRAKRGDIISAVFTLMRAYRQAGMPHSGKTLGSFEQWSREVAGLVEWLTGSNPIDLIVLSRGQDVREQQDTALLNALYEWCGALHDDHQVRAGEVLAAPFTARDVSDLVEKCEALKRDGTDLNVACRRSVLSNNFAGIPSVMAVTPREVDAYTYVADHWKGKARFSMQSFGHWASGLHDMPCGPFTLHCVIDPHTHSNVFVIGKQVDAVRADAERAAAERDSEKVVDLSARKADAAKAKKDGNPL